MYATAFIYSNIPFSALSTIPIPHRALLAPPNYNTFTNATIHSFSSQCPEVASSIVYLNTTVVNPGDSTDGQYISTLKEVAFWRFDDTGAVLYYDAWIPNLSLWFAKYSGVELDGNGLIPAVAQKVAIESLCGQIMQRCTGANAQYNSTTGGL